MNYGIKKYLLVGGIVYSPSDGQEHYISPIKLVKLYRLREDECILHGDPRIPIKQIPGIMILGPRPYGDYTEYLQYRLNEGAASTRPLRASHRPPISQQAI